MKKLLTTLAGLLLSAGLVTSAHAVALSELINQGGTIQAGDKEFSAFELLFTDSSDAGTDFDAILDNIDVTAIDDGSLNPGPGLLFSVLNNALSVTGDDVFAYLDLSFGFMVSVLDPGMRINGNQLRIDGSLTRNPTTVNDLGFFVQETIFNAPGGTQVAFNSAEFSVLDNDPVKSDIQNSVGIALASSLWVEKNIFVWATESDETAQMSSFSQRFAQVETTVPEPGALALFGIGALGLWGSRRRRMAA